MVGFELEPSCYYSTSDDVSTHAYLQPLSSLLGYALKKSFLLGFSVKILFLDKLSLIFVFRGEILRDMSVQVLSGRA